MSSRSRPPRLNAFNASSKQSASSRYRRTIFIFVILLGLFLVGTVIVLSSVSYYFSIPIDAFLTEVEVPWNSQDAIPLLKDPNDAQTAFIDPTTLDIVSETVEERHAADRFELTEIPSDQASTITVESAVSSPDISDALDTASEPGVPTGSSFDSELKEQPKQSGQDESPVWGVDGKGSGGYWMRADWDGKVHDTASWDRLYNITARPGEKIPRIIHQTWKSDELPEKWRKAWKECREGLPDYEYMLWTDDMSRKFIKEHYPAMLDMFDGYIYPIQRADAIRYFLLHHFGGIYMDLDIGCRRRLDPLLQGDWEVILPITKPVGISNDLIFSSKGSEFMDNTVHGLKSFDHYWVLNYPTVMFSTGPMFLSAQYAIYSAAHPTTPSRSRSMVRVLPKSLYGKNAPQEDVPHSFFSHFYGSSWHADDAGFITFLGTWGKGLMIIGAVVLALGALRLVWNKLAQSGFRFPWSKGNKRQYQLLPVINEGSESGQTSPTSTFSASGPLSPTFEHLSSSSAPPPLAEALRRAGHLILAAPATLLSSGPNGGSSSRTRQRGWLYFAPALFQPSNATGGRRRTASEASQLPMRRRTERRGSGGVSESNPPPYPGVSEPSDGMEEVDAFLKAAEPESSSDVGESSSSSAGPVANPVVADHDDRRWGDWKTTE